MKRIGIFLALLMASICSFSADTNKRVMELQKEAQTLLAQRDQLAKQIQQIEIRLYEIQGVMKFLNEAPKETNKK